MGGLEAKVKGIKCRGSWEVGGGWVEGRKGKGEWAVAGFLFDRLVSLCEKSRHKEEEMKVSIIIPVKEINDYIRESDTEINRLEYTDYEVIIFPDRDSGVKLSGARIIPTGPIGPAEKRDMALKYAKGEILAFLDDDAYPRSDWLKNAVIHFYDGKVAAVGGPAVTPPNDSRLQRASGAVFASRLTSSRYVYRYVQAAFREVDDLPSVNFLVRRSVFERLGGFDTGYWPGEDTKLCLDITKKLGLKIIYDPRVLVYHHRRALFAGHLRQVSRYAFQRGYFVKKFPETSLKPGYFVPSVFLLFITGGIAVSVFSSAAFFIFAAVMSLYAAALIAASIAATFETSDIAIGVVTLPGIFFTHVFYGYNFLKGLILAKRGACG